MNAGWFKTFRHGNLAERESAVLRMDFSTDGNRVLFVTSGGAIRVHDMIDGALLGAYQRPDENGKAIGAKFMPDGKIIYARSDGHVVVCNAETFEATKSWPYQGYTHFRDFDFETLGSGQLRLLLTFHSAVLSSDLYPIARSQIFLGRGAYHDSLLLDSGKYIAGANGHRSIDIWDRSTRDLRLQVQADSQCTQRIAVSPDGQRIAGGGGWRVASKLVSDGDFRLRVWDLSNRLSD